MSHIAFDLDALPLVPKVARSAGIQEAVVGWGLTQMWEWCWREKTDKVTTNHLRGFFGAELGAVLVDFGFLEAAGASLWRVRGAQRYLRLQAGRSKGGAAAKGNLKQFKAAAETPAEHRLKPSAGPAEMVQPEGGAGAYNRLTSGSPPADDRLTDRLTDRLNTGLSATSDELLLTAAPPGPQVVAKKPREPKKPVDPRFGPLVGRLKASFADLIGAGYDFTDADGGALKHLLGKADDDEIDRRWRSGLSADQFSAKCATVLQLAQRWNELAVVRATSPAAARREEPTAPRPEGRVFL